MNEGLLQRLFPAGWPGARTASGRLLLDNAPDVSPWAAIATAETHRVLPRDQVEASAWDVACLWLAKTPGSWCPIPPPIAIPIVLIPHCPTASLSI